VSALHDLKPQLIAEATAGARESAQQFARDADAELVGLRRANQGVFQILARDQAPGVSEEQPLLNTVLVVSTFDYYLNEYHHQSQRTPCLPLTSSFFSPQS